jgi:hypothetical protein
MCLLVSTMHGKVHERGGHGHGHGARSWILLKYKMNLSPIVNLTPGDQANQSVLFVFYLRSPFPRSPFLLHCTVLVDSLLPVPGTCFLGPFSSSTRSARDVSLDSLILSTQSHTAHP